jgi:3-isopropylmalate dehydratase small subunit
MSCVPLMNGAFFAALHSCREHAVACLSNFTLKHVISKAAIIGAGGTVLAP